MDPNTPNPQAGQGFDYKHAVAEAGHEAGIAAPVPGGGRGGPLTDPLLLPLGEAIATLAATKGPQAVRTLIQFLSAKLP